MAENILNIDLYESAYSCSEDEMIDHFRRAAEAEKAKGNGKTEFQDLYEASKKHKKLATAFYNIYEATRRDSPPKTVAKYIIDNEGKPALQIYRQLEGGHFDFSIHDGKVVLPEGLSEDKLLEVLDFLYRRGITNFELPASQRGTGFEELCQKVQAKREADPETHMPSPQSDPHYIPREEPEDESAEAALARPGVIGLSAEQPQGTQQQKTEKAPDSFNEVVRKFEDWLSQKQGKNEGSGYYKEGMKSKIFSVYDNNNNKNNLKNDGKKDKDDVIQERGLQYRVKLIEKDGKLAGIEYYIPNNGKLPDPLADQLAAMVKSQNALYMDFKEAPTQADAGVIRLACARAGIIPRGEGFNFNEIHAQKMIQEAQNALSEKDTFKYKGQMGRHLLNLCNGNTEDRRYETALKLIKQSKLYPLKEQLEGVLTKQLSERIRGGKAEEVIGSAKTIEKIFTNIADNPDSSISELCQALSDQDATLAAQLQQNLQNAGAKDSAVELTDEQMLILYKTLEAKEIEKTKLNLTNKINRNRGKDSEDTIINREVNVAYNALNRTVNKKLNDNGFNSGYSTVDFGNPTFEMPANNQPNTQTPRRTLNIGGMGGRGSI